MTTLDEELDATYKKINTLDKLRVYRKENTSLPSKCEKCGKTWDLNDKVYDHVELDRYYVKGVCRNCVKKHVTAQKL